VNCAGSPITFSSVFGALSRSMTYCAPVVSNTQFLTVWNMSVKKFPSLSPTPSAPPGRFASGSAVVSV